ncbi:Uncharacterised protein [Vibrio cholerae]|nr:Uncharacterised protein [Vibrio cholerae]
MEKIKYIFISIFLLFSLNVNALQENSDVKSLSTSCESFLNSTGKPDNIDIIRCTYDEVVKSNQSDNKQVLEYGQQTEVDRFIKANKDLSEQSNDFIYFYIPIITAIAVITFVIMLLKFLMLKDRSRAVNQKDLSRLFAMFLASKSVIFSLSYACVGLSIILVLSFTRSQNEVAFTHTNDNAVSVASYDEKIKVKAYLEASKFLQNSITQKLETNRAALLGYDDSLDIVEFVESNVLLECLKTDSNFDDYSFDKHKMSLSAYKLSKCQYNRNSGVQSDLFKGYIFEKTGSVFNAIRNEADKMADKVLNYYCGVEKLGFDQGSERNKSVCMTTDGIGYEEFISLDELKEYSNAYYSFVDNLLNNYVFAVNISEFEKALNTVKSNADDNLINKLTDKEKEQLEEYKQNLHYKRMQPLETMFKNTLLSIFDNFSSDNSETFFRENVLNSFTAENAIFIGNYQMLQKEWEDEKLLLHKNRIDLVVSKLYTTELNKESSLFENFTREDLFLAKKYLQNCHTDTEGNKNCKTLLKVNHAATDLMVVQVGLGGSIMTVGNAGGKAIQMSNLSDTQKASWGAKFESMEKTGSGWLGLGLNGFKVIAFVFCIIILIIFLQIVKTIQDLKIIAISASITGNIQIINALLKLITTLFFNIVAFFIMGVITNFVYSVFFDSTTMHLDYASLLQLLEINTWSMFTIFTTYIFYPIAIIQTSKRTNEFMEVEVDDLVQESKAQISKLKSVF